MSKKKKETSSNVKIVFYSQTAQSNAEKKNKHKLSFRQSQKMQGIFPWCKLRDDQIMEVAQNVMQTNA